MKYWLLALAFCAISCHENRENEAFTEGVEAVPPMFEQSDAGKRTAYDIKRLDLQLVVDDLAQAESWVKEATQLQKGKVTGHTHFSESLVRSSHLTVQVPVKQLNAWIAALEHQKGWKLTGKQLNISSIEQQYVDHAQRLKTRQALEQRYTELLKQAKNMADVLAIEEKLLNLRSEIEWMQTEKGSMDNQMAYAECSVRLEEQLSAWQRLARQSGQQFREGWHVLVNLLLFLFKSWPLLLLGLGGYGLYQKRKNRKA